MAIVLIRFTGGDVSIVTGAMPPDKDTPISSPTPISLYKISTGTIEMGKANFRFPPSRSGSHPKP
jgi:hypothetical protein